MNRILNSKYLWFFKIGALPVLLIALWGNYALCGTISGNLYQSDGTTLVTGTELEVQVTDANWPCNDGGTIDTVRTSNGVYSISGLSPGTYYIRIENNNSSNYVEEWWTAEGGEWGCPNAETVTITSNEEDVTGIDFNLELGGAISGILFDDNNGLPLTGVSFEVYAYGGNPCGHIIHVEGASVNSGNGTYIIKGIPKTPLFVLASTDTDTFYDQWWNDLGGYFLCYAAESVTVPADNETVDSINFQIGQTATISGTIRETGSYSTLEAVCVTAYREDPCNDWQVATAITDKNGNYTISGVPGDNYSLQTDVSCVEQRNILNQWWTPASGVMECERAAAVTVSDGQDVTDVNFFLDPGFTIHPLVVNNCLPQGGYETRYQLRIGDNFVGDPQNDIQSVTVTTPDNDVLTLTWDDQKSVYQMQHPGATTLGAYTFGVVSGTIEVSQVKYYDVFRDLALKDTAKYTPTSDSVVSSKTPIFEIPVLDGHDVVLYYRLILWDDAGNEIYESDIMYQDCNHRYRIGFAAPENVLTSGSTYWWSIKVYDRNEKDQAQNYAQSEPIHFQVAQVRSHPSPPAITEDNWGVYSWNGYGPYFSLFFIDHDGVAPDGSSHSGSVVSPGGMNYDIKPMGNYYSPPLGNYNYLPHWGEYETWDWAPAENGSYTYTIVDADGNSAVFVDNYTHSQLDPPDENSIQPSLKTEYITGHLDDFWVNGIQYENFNSYSDLTELDYRLWERPYGNGVDIDDGRLALAQGNVIANSRCGVRFLNGQSIRSMQATVVVTDASSDIPWIGLAGFFYNDGVYDVWVEVKAKSNRVEYTVDRDIGDGSWQNLTHGELLTNLSPGQPVTLEISLDESTETLTLSADGNSMSYQPAGMVLSPRIATKELTAALPLVMDNTTPSFDWDPVANAKRYRIRIYSHDRSRTILRHYVGNQTQYTIPPGLLEPNTEYQLRIRAHDEYTGFDLDSASATDSRNYKFFTGAESAAPLITTRHYGVQTKNDPINGEHLSFEVIVHDAQGVPDDIAAVTVRFPDGQLYNLYHDPDSVDPYSLAGGIYRGIVYTQPQAGNYTFSAHDKGGHSFSLDENLVDDPIGYPDLAMTTPTDHTVLGNTEVDFDWPDVAGAVVYQIQLYDEGFRPVNGSGRDFHMFCTQSELHLAAGHLKANNLYRYRINAYREYPDDSNDNQSTTVASPVDMPVFLTGATSGTQPPAIDLENRGVGILHTVRPDGAGSTEDEYWLTFEALVEDADGIPANINSVTAVGPSGAHRLKFDKRVSSSQARYWGHAIYNDPAGIAPGDYTFTVTDADGNQVQATDTLVKDVLPIPENCVPANGVIVDGTLPLIAWDAVPGATRYRVRIYEGWDRHLHWSDYLQDPRYTLPPDVIQTGHTYAYQVYAYREAAPDTDVDNRSTNSIHVAVHQRFTTAADTQGPAMITFAVSDASTGSTQHTDQREVAVEMAAGDNSATVWRYLVTETTDTPTVEQMLAGSPVPVTAHTIQSAGDGLKQLYGWAMDYDHNIGLPAMAEIELDTQTVVTVDPVLSPTDSATQTIGGQREDNAAVEVACDTATVAPVTYPSAGTWSAILSELTLGPNPIDVAAEDALGNRGSAQTAIDYTLPASATISSQPTRLPADGSSVAQLTIEVTGSDGLPVLDGTRVEVATSLGTLGGSGATVGGSLQRTLTAPTQVGNAEITVRSDTATLLGSTTVPIDPGPVDRLRFTSPAQSGLINAWTQIRIETQDANGFESPVSQDTNIHIAATSPTGRILIGFTWYDQTAQATIGQGQSSLTFVYEDSNPGMVQIGADEDPDLGWSGDSYGLTVNATPPHTAFISAAKHTLRANGQDTVALTIEVFQDVAGNPVADGTVVAVTSDLGMITGSGGTVNGRILRELMAGQVPGIAHLDVTAGGGTPLDGGVNGDTSITFEVENPLNQAALVPAAGYGDTEFNFSVDYINPGLPPTSAVLVLDGIGREMQLAAGNADHGTYGCTAQGLAVGSAHEYYFYFSDGVRTFQLPANDRFIGPTVQLHAADIGLNLSTEQVSYGQSLTFSGTITPARAAVVHLLVTDPDGSARMLPTTSQADGFYTLDFVPGRAGDDDWTVRARCPADDLHRAAESTVASFTATRADTALSLAASPIFLTLGGKVSAQGKVTCPAPVPLNGLSLDLVFTDPAGNETVQTLVTSGSDGTFALASFDQFDRAGEWNVQARFAGNAVFNPQDSDIVDLNVSPVAGYAIVVQGKLLDDSLLEWHNITANTIYDHLLALGFSHDDIYYFNYDDTQPNVDAATAKAGIESTIKEWARDRMNTVAAPLYIVFIDHGDVDKFYLGAEFISAQELDLWLGDLEEQLTPDALAQKIVFIYGACHSGSFVPVLSRIDKNRIIITSADTEELSYPATPAQGENIANGEFFLEKFFGYAAEGVTVRSCFELAADAARKRFQVPLVSNAFGWKHGDMGIQHAVLDDDGDGLGTHYLPTTPPGDGFVAHSMVIGIPPENPGNVRIEQVLPLVEIQEGTLPVPLWAQVSDVSRCESVWASIRRPDYAFNLDPTQNSTQAPDWPTVNCTYRPETDRYEFEDNTPFDIPGVYELHFHARDSQTGKVSPARRTYLVNRQAGDTAPEGFDLLKPADNQQQTTSLVLQWAPTADPIDGEAVSYIVQVDTDTSFDDPVTQAHETDPFHIVDKFSNLENLATYVWRVLAVDAGGGLTVCNQQWHRFTTFNGNGEFGMIRGHVGDESGADIAMARIEVPDIPTINATTLPNGWFTLSITSGQYNLRFSAENYDEKYQTVAVQAGGITPMQVQLTDSRDRIAPDVSLIDPAADGTVGTPGLNIRGLASDQGGSGLEKVEVSLDGGQTWSPASGSYNWSHPVHLAVGAHVVQARAWDLAGNQGVTAPVNITFTETSKPEVTSVVLSPVSPAGAGTVDFTVTFNEAMDPAQAPTVAFGDPPRNVAGAYQNATIWQGSYAVGPADEGPQTLTVSAARDAYGNVMEPDDAHSFEVDTTAPTMPTIATRAQTVISNAIVVSLSQGCTDPHFSHYQLKGGLYADWTDTTLTNNFFFGLEPLSTTTLQVRGVDLCGNRSPADGVQIERRSRLNRGDINGDHDVDVADAILSLQAMSGQPAVGITFDYPDSGADVDGDCQVGSPETSFILNAASEE